MVHIGGVMVVSVESAGEVCLGRLYAGSVGGRECSGDSVVRGLFAEVNGYSWRSRSSSNSPA